ncbi:hypothetical protein BCR44DRAFT_243844 [Catenaria anguillulae PL171]|uniref:Uncharacterized protein n=1 Tax=Catenaria anguillulae PL171 TaxID=765915 RepID=A0A1Y2HSR3_9FUNG|nr:hypothetical protein BCR44DRAFT_243844 [Catenaria anguillulae PL171]
MTDSQNQGQAQGVKCWFRSCTAIVYLHEFDEVLQPQTCQICMRVFCNEHLDEAEPVCIVCIHQRQTQGSFSLGRQRRRVITDNEDDDDVRQETTTAARTPAVRSVTRAQGSTSAGSSRQLPRTPAPSAGQRQPVSQGSAQNRPQARATAEDRATETPSKTSGLKGEAEALRRHVPSLNRACRFVALFRFGFVCQADEEKAADALRSAVDVAFKSKGLDASELTTELCLHLLSSAESAIKQTFKRGNRQARRRRPAPARASQDVPRVHAFQPK